MKKKKAAKLLSKKRFDPKYITKYRDYYVFQVQVPAIYHMKQRCQNYKDYYPNMLEEKVVMELDFHKTLDVYTKGYDFNLLDSNSYHILTILTEYYLSRAKKGTKKPLKKFKAMLADRYYELACPSVDEIDMHKMLLKIKTPEDGQKINESGKVLSTRLTKD